MANTSEPNAAEADAAGTGSSGQGWDPSRYGQFEAERSQPFFDLAALVEPDADLRILDLGCGTGQLTAWLHRQLGARETLGIDRSTTMIERAAPHAGDGVQFRQTAIEPFLDEQPARGWPLVFSNAALQWLPDHPRLLPRIAALVADGGQLAIQMPANADHPSHRIARELAHDPRFAGPLGGYEREDTLQAPEWYASTLHELGFPRPHVRVQVYGHVLPSTRSVSDWVQGSLLTPYRERLSEADYLLFLETYEARVSQELGDHAPYFYPFKRLLIRARRESPAP